MIPSLACRLAVVAALLVAAAARSATTLVEVVPAEVVPAVIVPPEVARPEPAALAARFPEPVPDVETPGLNIGREAPTRNDELRAALRELAARPGGPRLLAAGRSGAGEAIEALHFTRGAGRPAVLLVGQQHGDEPAGAEALLMLARWLAGAPGPSLLDRIDVIVLPRANPDGAAAGTRRGRHGIDINRDHLLLQTPEAQALALLARVHRPVLVVDLHEYAALGDWQEIFGALPRHDLLLQYATTANLPPALTEAAELWFRQPLLRALDAAGLSHDWYHTRAATSGDLRLAMGGPQPEIARNAQGLRHAVSFLVESRGSDLGRRHLRRRVHGHGVALRSLLGVAAARADELTALQQRLDAEVAGLACRGELVVLAGQTPTRREILMLDPATGADRRLAVLWQSSLELRPLIVRPRPCGYWLAPEAGEAARRLQALGLRVERLAVATELQAERWRELPPLPLPGPAASAGGVDGRLPRLVSVRTEPLRLQAPVGSWWLPLDQPLAHLASAVLEPDTPGSWFAQRLLPTLASAARVMAMPPP